MVKVLFSDLKMPLTPLTACIQIVTRGEPLENIRLSFLDMNVKRILNEGISNAGVANTFNVVGSRRIGSHHNYKRHVGFYFIYINFQTG